MARVARVCPGMHVGDERHNVVECRAFNDIRCGFQRLFDDMGPCVFSCDAHARRALLSACCNSSIGLLKL